MPEEMYGGRGRDLDLWFKIILAVLTAQKNSNYVNVSGNNNEIQIPNEAGPGDVVQK
ncbi:MAG: hypothetical protein ACOYVK_12840 [Bacillota bacterium]